MILLTVQSYNGAPASGPQAGFDELGGTIGRADSNQLVLPDPERTISRVHARIVFRTHGYTIVDNGSNPISVNGQPLGSGREHPLKAGDQVQIGGYLLAVTEGAASAATAKDDPFADLFGDATGGLATPHAAPAPVRSVMHTWSPPPAPAAAAPGAIPDDWDPFGPDVPPAPAPARAPAPALADVPIAAPGADSLDDLFGLRGAPTPGDPLGGVPQQAFAMQPNTAADADPLRALGRPAAIAPPTAPTYGSELNTPMPLPGAAAPAAPQLPAGAVFSWDKPVPTMPMAAPAPAPRTRPAPPVLNTEWPVPPAPARAATPAVPLVAPAPRAAAAPAAAVSADEAALIAALLDGLGMPDLRIEHLTPGLLKLIGQLLRESTRGAVELLVARAALKREMRADVTMIVARENNPLKFSPSVEVALHHLLSPPAPGFMAAAPAVRDAFDDLRAHQLGVMAGMKAALDGVLQRFSPMQLEAKLSKGSTITNLIPAARKARLWELFQELFGQISNEAQDDFDELFGKAFLRAYEAQLDRLHNETPPR